MSEEAKKKTFRASVGRFTEVEDKLYLWIDSMRRANLPLSTFPRHFESKENC